MKLAIVMATGGGLSGGSQKTMSLLIPKLANDSDIARTTVYAPHRVMDLIDRQDNLLGWPDRERFTGYPTLKRLIAQSRPDVVFIPNGVWISFDGVPVVVMVRNMEALAQPIGKNNINACLKNLARRARARRASIKATRVIAVSNFVKQYLLERWHIAPEKIDVVYHGVEAAPPADQITAPKIAPKESGGPFYFTAGSFVHYRGYEDLVHALCRLRSLGIDAPVLVAGTAMSNTLRYQQQIEQLARDHRVQDRIIWAGQLNRREMSWCYCHCTAFVMTSRLEACPNIVLESLAHGCVSISTMHPPMPEIYGPGASYYRAGDIEELVAQMIRASEMRGDERARRSAKVRGQASKYTWDITAQRTKLCLQQAMKTAE